MIDRNTAYILARLCGGLRQVIGEDLALCVGGYRKFAGAIFRVRGELIESRRIQVQLSLPPEIALLFDC